MTAVGIRRRIVELLELGPRSLARIASELELDLGLVRDELRRMRDAGLVRSSSLGWALRPHRHHTHTPRSHP